MPSLSNPTSLVWILMKLPVIAMDTAEANSDYTEPEEAWAEECSEIRIEDWRGMSGTIGIAAVWSCTLGGQLS